MSSAADQPAAGPPIGGGGLTGQLLGASPRWDGQELAAEIGTEAARVWQYWQALGLPPPSGDSALFTTADVTAARALLELVRSGEITRHEALDIVRGIGQTTSRLAEWLAPSLLAEGGPEGAPDARLERILPTVEGLLLHGWRRHLLAALQRSASAPAEQVLCIGFADIAGFTGMARAATDADLAAAVVHFETSAADTITAAGARLIKTVGDEIMFAANTALAGAAVGTALHAGGASGALPLRVGLATGPVITAMGDLYGDTVNLAARLTGMARPGTTLIDPATAEALQEVRTYRVRKLSQRRVPGLGLVSPSSLRTVAR